MKTKYKFPLFILLSLMFFPVFGQGSKLKIKSYRDTYYSVREEYGKTKKGARLHDTLYVDQVVSFEQNGNTTQVTEYDADGKINGRFTGSWDYLNNNSESVFIRFGPELIVDKKPFLISSVKYPSGELCEITYEVDAMGRPVKETIFDLMGRVIYTINILRDQNGNALEYNFSDGTVERYKYDDKGNRTEWVSHASNGIMTSSFQYDAHGNIIEMDISNSFLTKYKFHNEHNTYKYVYDKPGNWIERTDYEHDIPVRIVMRTIEYGILSPTLICVEP